MEQETKYAIDGIEKADAVWESVLSGKYAKITESEILSMKAVYFDTESRALKKNAAAR